MAHIVKQEGQWFALYYEGYCLLRGLPLVAIENYLHIFGGVYQVEQVEQFEQVELFARAA